MTYDRLFGSASIRNPKCSVQQFRLASSNRALSTFRGICRSHTRLPRELDGKDLLNRDVPILAMHWPQDRLGHRNDFANAGATVAPIDAVLARPRVDTVTRREPVLDGLRLSRAPQDAFCTEAKSERPYSIWVARSCRVRDPARPKGPGKS